MTEKTRRMGMPEKPFNAGGGNHFERRFNVAHLEHQNPLAKTADAELAARLKEQADQEAGADAIREMLLLSRAAGGARSASAEEIESAIARGNGLGLAGGGNNYASALLWAAAARALRHAGADHVNDMP